MKLFCIISLLAFFAQSTWADAGSDKDLSSRVGFVAGPYLPSKISGVNEVLQVTGLRLGGNFQFGNFEAEGIVGNGSGINFESIIFNYRLNVASDIFPVHALLGVHADSFRKADATSSSGGGWQIGGGAESRIGGPFFIRSDFEYRFGPGTSLLVLVSLMLHF